MLSTTLHMVYLRNRKEETVRQIIHLLLPKNAHLKAVDDASPSLLAFSVTP